MMRQGKRKKMLLKTDAQRRAFTSPLRMELISMFLDRDPLSVAQMAKRMGRTATSLHYHVGVLEKAGLLERVGTRRAGRRSEALYLPAADLFEVQQDRNDVTAATVALTTLSTAFRMAEGDMRAALHDPRSKTEGPYRNLFAARVHCRLSKKDLAELNRHLRTIEKMLSQVDRKREPSTDDRFVSLTLALLPLRNREALS